jgi:hypothetical protein
MRTVSLQLAPQMCNVGPMHEPRLPLHRAFFALGDAELNTSHLSPTTGEPSPTPDGAGLIASDAARPFLNRLPPDYSGALANFYHEVVRDGLTEPRDIVAAVICMVGKRLARPNLAEKRVGAYNGLLSALGEEPTAAQAYARDVVAWNQLPPEERQRRKEGQAETFRHQRMAELPPTSKQLDFLRTLGDEGPPPGNRAEASARIETLKSQRSRTAFGEAFREKAGLTGEGKSR